MKLTQKSCEVSGPRRFALIAACAALGLATCASALALRLPVNALPTGETAAQPPTKLTVAAAEMAGNIVSRQSPKYPAEAKKARIQGTVKLDAVIGKDGNIEKLTVASGPKELQESSLDAVRQWTYKPYLLNGDPVEVETSITVIYSLGK